MSDARSQTPAGPDAGEVLFRKAWRFVLSAPTLEALPPESRTELAFVGRSNVGKSSLINALTGQSGLARASNTPGRTQELVLFEAPGVALRLVDMPGYGYAEAPRAKVEAWTALVRAYLAGRRTLRRVFLLVDARHGLKPVDREIMAMLDVAAVSFQVVLTKADKVAPPALEAVRTAATAALSAHPAAHPQVLASSAARKLGLDDLKREIAALAGFDPAG